MDYYTNQTNSYNNPQNVPPVYGADGEGLARAAFTMGLIALVACRMPFLSTILAAIAIILAIISRGYQRTFLRKTRNAVIIATIAIVANLVLSVSALSKLSEQMQSEEFKEQFNQMYEQIYGVPYDESLGLWEDETL